MTSLLIATLIIRIVISTVCVLCTVISQIYKSVHNYLSNLILFYVPEWNR